MISNRWLRNLPSHCDNKVSRFRLQASKVLLFKFDPIAYLLSTEE
jgi:hypothetical protein